MKHFRRSLLSILAATLSVSSTLHAQGTGYWHTSGNKILDSNNNAVRIAGVNWYGFETTRAVPGGLTSQDYKTVLSTIKNLGYNTIRVPMSNQMVETPSYPSSISYNNGINADLNGLNSLQILDKIVTYAGTLGLKVILDNHRSEAGDSAESNGLWYTGSYSESAWIGDWTALANRYLNNPTVIGFDLRNEPHNAYSGGSCWDCGSSTNDWHLAAERAGNAVLAVNPKLLVFVEGTDAYNNDYYWWGGNLEGVSNSPVVLKVANQLVYSAHDYGPAVYGQSWFNGSTSYSSLAAVWMNHWGYISQNSVAPVWVGEFGTPNDAASVQSSVAGSEGQWFSSLVQYLSANSNLSWTYWALNGEDSLALLDGNYDATPVSSAKQSLLASIQFPLSPGSGVPAPAAPTNVTATAISGSAIGLAWTASATSGVTYTVSSGTVSGASGNVVASGLTGTTYTASGLNVGTTYYFMVRAVSGSGSSAASNQASASTQAASGGAVSCHVAYLDQNDWGSGFTGSLSLTNSGSTALSSWTVTWTYSGNQQLNQAWNSNYTQSGKTVVLTNASWNPSIAAGATVTGIGWNANYSGANVNPTVFYVNGSLCH